MSKRNPTKRQETPLATKGAGPLLAEWTGRYQANARRIVEVTRACFEIVPQVRTEMAK
jgi:hypothetical protein